MPNNATNIGPQTLPNTLSGPLDWNGCHFSETCPEYVVQLSEGEIRHVENALRLFKGRCSRPEQVSRQTFCLPKSLAKRLGSISDEIHNGRGFAVVRGLKPGKYTAEETVTIFAGIASYVCSERATDPVHQLTLSPLPPTRMTLWVVSDSMTGHVRDATKDVQPASRKGLGLAGSKVPDALAFHADRFAGDVLSLFVLNKGSKVGGGEQHIASFFHIYNELARTEPAVLETLAAPDWPWELKDENFQNPHVECAPAMFITAGRPQIQLVRAPLQGTQRLPRCSDLPSLTAAQEYALKAVERIATKSCLTLNRKNGDIQFINNLGVLHARSAYSAEKKCSRHLLRMFLRDPRNAWAKPKEYADLFDSPFGVDRAEYLPVTDHDPWRQTASGTSFSHG